MNFFLHSFHYKIKYRYYHTREIEEYFNKQNRVQIKSEGSLGHLKATSPASTSCGPTMGVGYPAEQLMIIKRRTQHGDCPTESPR